jgi:DNA-binding cell septation regulator SpoVG
VNTFRILDWRGLRKNSLRGFAKVELPSGMVVADVTVLTGERGPWASPPSKPMIDRDGAVMKDAAGKIRYVPIIDFVSKDVRNKFSAAVIEAMRASHPEAFDDER